MTIGLSQREMMIEAEELALWKDEGTWFEFLNNVGCDPDYENLMQMARLSLIPEPTPIEDVYLFYNQFAQAYRKWCEDQARACADTKGWL